MKNTLSYFWEKKHKEMSHVKSLDELIVKRLRTNIGHFGLPHKTFCGTLKLRTYNKNCKCSSQR